MREYKSTPQWVKKIDGRTVTGIFSVFGNIDSYGDIVMPGAFAKTFAERGAKMVHLWQHDFSSPPTAIIRSLREIGRDELPQDVLSQFPEALGGAEVTREYLDTPRGNEVLAAIQAGSPLQMSFAYDPVKFDFGEQGDRHVRYLRELRGYETSDVLWGANDATVAAKFGLPFDALLKALETHLAAVKAGRRHSDADMRLLNAIHHTIVDLGCDNCKGLIDETEDTPKSRAADEALTRPDYSRKLRAAQQALALMNRNL